MNWFEQLASFYAEDDIPLFHWEYYTDAEVKLTVKGEFAGAVIKRIKTTIPVTESSFVRTFGVHPHPLTDTLKYLAGDEKHHTEYIKRLSLWVNSDYCTEELLAVWKYLGSNSILSDLVRAGAAPESYSGMMIRFSVDGVRLWEDEKLRSAYISFVRSDIGEKVLCCAAGDHDIPAKIHPKRILRSDSSAKLISYAENERIVYSGRFTESGQVFPIGRECSFKAHVVLKRLLEQGGSCFGSRVFAAWDSMGNTVPLPFDMTAECTPLGEVTVMGFDEVTRGRISVTFYRRLSCGEYTARVNKYCSKVKNISTERIAALSFGRRSTDGGLSCNGGLLAQTAERLLGCVLDDRDIPTDIMRKLEIRCRDRDYTDQAQEAYSALWKYSYKEERDNVGIRA